MKINKLFLIFYSTLFSIISTAHCSVSADPFTVESSFSATKLLDTVFSNDISNSYPFLLSKDGKQLYLILTSGIPSLKTYKFRLLMYNVSDIANYARGHWSQAPVPNILFENTYNQATRSSVFPHHHAGIRQLTLYENDRYLAFLAADENGIHQLYRFDLNKNQLDQITQSKQEIIDYKIFPGGHDALYITAAPKKNGYSDHCLDAMYSPLDFTFFEATCTPSGLSIAEQYASASAEGPPRNPANLYRVKLAPFSDSISIVKNIHITTTLSDGDFSPDQTKIILRVRVNTIPPELEEDIYNSEFYRILKRMYMVSDDDIPGPGTQKFLSYDVFAIVDLNSSELSILHEVPFLPYKKIENPIWVDNNYIVLQNDNPLYKPMISPSLKLFNALKNKEVYNRNIIFDIKSKIYITPSDIITSNQETPSPHLSWNQANIEVFPDNAFFKYQCPKTSQDDDVEDDIKRACFIEIPAFDLRIMTGERFDRPPNILAQDLRSGKIRVVLELNPQFKSLSLSTNKIIKIKDNLGKTWVLGLALPPKFKKGFRYPLVIQTHGFDRDTFLLDGPPYMTAPYAAQALANKGIVVLQVPDAYTWDGSGFMDPQIARVVNTAVNELDSKGLIRKDKVGITGFSATGRYALRTALFPDDFRPAAIVVSDSMLNSPFSQTILYNVTPSSYSQAEIENCNNQPWGGTQNQWTFRQIFFHLEKLRSPVLFQEYNQFPLNYWDILMGLKRLKKPIDAYVFNSGQHVQTRADNVLLAQQQVVDWFDFWLNDRFAPRNRDNKQFEKWQRLKQLKNNLILSSQNNPDGRLSQMDCPAK